MDQVCGLLLSYMEFFMFWILITGLSGRDLRKNERILLFGSGVVAVEYIINITIHDQAIALLLSCMMITLYFCLGYHIHIFQSLFFFFISYIVIVFLEFVIYSLLKNTVLSTKLVPFICSGSVILICFLIFLICPLDRLGKAFKSKWLLVVAGNSFMILGMVILFRRINPQNFMAHYLFLFMSMLFVIVVDGITLFNYFRTTQEQKELKMYQTYLPVVENLISDVRQKQHNYANSLQSIRGLAFSCKDFNALKNALLQNTREDLYSDYRVELMRLNRPLFAGFLFSKIISAEQKGISVQIEMQTYHVASSIPEYELVSCIGILLDNAVEASSSGETIWITLGDISGKMIFEIDNKGNFLNADFCRRIFTKGYSTKKKGDGTHGLGLYWLSKYTEQHHGEIILKTVQHNGEQYLRICLKI